jgi:hypothetical protein
MILFVFFAFTRATEASLEILTPDPSDPIDSFPVLASVGPTGSPLPEPTDSDDWFPEMETESFSTLVVGLFALLLLAILVIMGICCYRKLNQERTGLVAERVDEPLLNTAEVF